MSSNDNAESRELKPCPFCPNGEGEIKRGYEHGSMMYFTRCVAHKNPKHVIAAYGLTQNEADTAWNTRPQPRFTEAELVEVALGTYDKHMEMRAEYPRNVYRDAIRALVRVEQQPTGGGEKPFHELIREPMTDWTAVRQREAMEASLRDAPAIVAAISPTQPQQAATKSNAGVELPSWLMGSAQALLDLDAKGSLVPHGIGGHARSIIQAFIDAHAALTLSPPAAGEQVERVTAAIYDAFHNSTLPSMQGKLRTAGDMKDYVTKLVLAALPTPPDGGTE